MPLQPVVEMSRLANRIRDIDWSFFFCCFPQELNGDQSDAAVQIEDHADNVRQSSGRSVRRHTKGLVQVDSTFGTDGLHSATVHHSKNEKEVVIFRQTPRHKSVQQAKTDNGQTMTRGSLV